MEEITHKLSIDLPAREIRVYEYEDAPSQFAHFKGTEKDMLRIADILDRGMGRMDKYDRSIPLTPEEEREIEELTGEEV